MSGGIRRSLSQVNTMQNTELYRRGVVLPLDNDAEEALRSNEVDEATNMRLLEIADEGAVRSPLAARAVQ